MKTCHYSGRFWWCKGDAKHTLPMGPNGTLLWFCTPCFDKVFAKLQAWARGDDTDRNMIRARGFMKKHAL